MSVATSTLLGRPVWYELMTTDMKRPKSSIPMWSAGRRSHSTALASRTPCSTAAVIRRLWRRDD
jgi:hypothetical protein